MAPALPALSAWLVIVERSPELTSGTVGTDSEVSREVMFVKSNCMLVRMMRPRKRRSHYEDGDKTGLLIAWVAYNIETKRYTEDSGDRKGDHEPS